MSVASTPKKTNPLKSWEASLPKAREWEQWMAYHLTAIRAEPWGEFLLDEALHLQQFFVLASRRIRQNPTWDPSMDEREWLPLAPLAHRALADFERDRPRTLTLDSGGEAPQWAKDLCEFQWGAYRMLVRLAEEVDAVRRNHYLCVNINPHAQPGDLAGVEVAT